MNIYNGDFTNKEDIIDIFEIDSSLLDDAEVIYAEYNYENYEGSAWVIYLFEGKLYEVNGGHCSCYSLENQWEPQITSVKSILMRDLEPKLVQMLKDRFDN